jgi:hypothetical protein
MEGRMKKLVTILALTSFADGNGMDAIKNSTTGSPAGVAPPPAQIVQDATRPDRTGEVAEIQLQRMGQMLAIWLCDTLGSGDAATDRPLASGEGISVRDMLEVVWLQNRFL